jgi:heme/copper-type cytochrome/quinol oxidase subunit 4
MSATSAFLAVAYIVGKNLQSLLVGLVVGIYSLTAIYFIIIFQRHWTSLIVLREQMNQMKLWWFPAVAEPQFFLPSAMWIGVFVMSILYVGSVWYLFSIRKNSDEHT